MSTALAGPRRLAPPPGALDHRRGTIGMQLFIVTEAMLFLMLFFTYFYLGHDAAKWPTDAPRLRLALPMLAILVGSSFVLYLVAEEGEKQGRLRRARAGVVITIIMGVTFIVLQVFEYMDRMKTILPTSDAYGSIFYAMTGLHGAHVVLGLLMLGYLLLLPERHWGPADKPPHHVLHNVGLYWHFVDLVWVFIVGLLYVMPNLQR
jgi:heme/copper-type cytochrome/quinol oxidase subunit 3